MNEQDAPFWLNALIAVAGFAGLYTWYQLIVRKGEGKPFLDRVARRSVPWGPMASALTVSLVVVNVLAFFTGEANEQALPEVPSELIDNIIQSAGLQFAIIGLILGSIRIITQANAVDFGLPTSLRILVRDLWLGASTYAAVLIPVFGTMALLSWGADSPGKQHPFIEILSETPDPQVYCAIAFLVVVLAPLFEEIFFRLLLQGWLERWETETYSTEENLETAEVPEKGVAGLPFGWFPILVSSTLFAAAHVGAGFAPIALIPFAIILGYVYQRTHRIVPCMIAHALFNATTVLSILAEELSTKSP